MKKAKGEAGPEIGQTKNSKKIFYRYNSQKRKVREGKQGWQMKVDKMKAEDFKNFIFSVFNGNLSSHISCVDELLDGDWGRKAFPIVSDDQFHDHLRYLILLKSMGPSEMHCKNWLM